MANYMLMVVYRDGNPQDVASFGPDLATAIHRLKTKNLVEQMKQAFRGTPITCVWFVYDADDPERGYFDEIEDACEFGGTQ